MIENWTETTYIFPLDDKGNYLPIYVFDCDITSKELEKMYPDNSTQPQLAGSDSSNDSGSYFLVNNSLIDFYNTIYMGIKTDHDTTYHSGTFKNIKNDYFTITQPPYESSYGHFILKNDGDTIADFKIFCWGYGGVEGSKWDGEPDRGSFIQIYLSCIKTSDDVYYGSHFALIGSSGFKTSGGSLVLPSHDSKGFLTNPTYDYMGTFTIDITVPSGDYPYSKNIGNLIRTLIGKSKKLDPKDPDPNIDDSDGDHGRTPTDDIGGNTIGDDDLPTLSVMDTGLVTLYNPTVGQLQALGHFLWSDAFSVDTFKKLFADPFDTLLGLSILPVTPKVSGSHNIYFGNIDSGVNCNVVRNQFLKVDMGSLTLNETYASAFDYAPSTQVDIYLPFIGSHGLNTNDVMGSTLHLIYKFDLLSGGCIAELFINHTSQGNKGKGMKYNKNMGLAYTFSGQCSCSIPLTSNNYNGMIQGLIQSIGTIGGIGASVATGNPALGIASVATSAATIGLQANTPTVQRSGSIGSSNALLSCLTPYLSVQRAHVCKPGHFYSKRGIPSQVYVGNISSIGSGNYFQIADCADLHANGASDTELSEIKSILTSGAVW